MNECKPDVVFHLAAMTNVMDCEKRPEEAFDTNGQGTLNIATSVPSSCRVVLASTCHVYQSAEGQPLTEQSPVGPSSTYGNTKLEAERLILKTHANTVVARAFHHAGPGQSVQYVIADWAHQMRQGQCSIRVGDTRIRRDFSDVRDIVAGYICLARSRHVPDDCA